MNDFAAIKNLLTNFAAGINKLFNPSFEDQRQQYTIEGSREANSLDTNQLTRTEQSPTAGRTSNPWPGTQSFDDFRSANDPLRSIREEVNSKRQATNSVKNTTEKTSNPWPGTKIFEDFRAEGDPLKAVRDVVNSKNTEETKADEPVEETTLTVETPEDEEDVVEYTYKPGDTFGQVILDLGLMTDNGLWGTNGDVAYYTQQLIDQGMLDERGNVKLNVPFKLRRRK